MGDRVRVLEAIFDPHPFTAMLVSELQGAARRNEVDPHLVTVNWNPNNWHISATIRPNEEGKTSLSLMAANKWGMVLEYDDGRLKSLTPMLAERLREEIAFSFLDLLKQIPEEELETGGENVGDHQNDPERSEGQEAA